MKSKNFCEDKLIEYTDKLNNDEYEKYFFNSKPVENNTHTRAILSLYNSKIMSFHANEKHVGDLPKLFQEYLNSIGNKEPSIEGWTEWFLNCENVFKHVEKPNTKIIRNNIKSGKDALNLAFGDVTNIARFLDDEHKDGRGYEFFKNWISNYIFNKTFNEQLLEKPLVSFICEKLFTVNDMKEDFDYKKIVESTIKQKAWGIDYVYNDNELMLFFKINAVTDDEFFSEISSHKSLLNVYCCSYVKNGKNIKLIVKYNGKKILKID